MNGESFTLVLRAGYSRNTTKQKQWERLYRLSFIGNTNAYGYIWMIKHAGVKYDP